MVLDQADIVEKIRTKTLQVIFDYNDMNKVMRIIKEHQLDIVSQNLAEKGVITLAIRLDDYANIKSLFEKIHTLNVQEPD
jgi:putative IMPACT (imprinted ancient) family translation regulator